MGRTVGIVKGQQITQNRAGDTVRLLQVQLLGDNPETVEFININGEDSAPITGDKIVVYEVSNGYKITLGIRDNITPVSVAGEKELYSYNDSGKLGRLKTKLDGSIGIKNELQGIDFLTAFTAYNTAIKGIIDSNGDTVSPGSQTDLDNALSNVLKVISGI